MSRLCMRACSCSVMSNSLQPHGLQPARFLCPWDFPGKNTEVGCHFLLQGIFSTQGSNLRLLHWQADSLLVSHQVPLVVLVMQEIEKDTLFIFKFLSQQFVSKQGIKSMNQKGKKKMMTKLRTSDHQKTSRNELKSKQ